MMSKHLLQISVAFKNKFSFLRNQIIMPRHQNKIDQNNKIGYKKLVFSQF